jgi:hypothetical protein
MPNAPLSMKSPESAPPVDSASRFKRRLALEDDHDHGSLHADDEPHDHDKESGCGNGCRSCPRCASKADSIKT